MIINSKDDLDSLSESEKQKLLNLLAASLNNWNWSEDLQDWVLVKDLKPLERLGLTEEDLPDPIIPEKPAPLEPPQPLPDWDQFNFAMLSDPDFNEAASTVPPLTISALTAGLTQVQAGNYGGFALAYNLFKSQSAVSAEILDAWKGYAIAANLPEGFIGLL